MSRKQFARVAVTVGKFRRDKMYKNNQVLLVIEKEDDPGYTHFEGPVPYEMIPKVGEVISVPYPDENCNIDGLVIEIKKEFHKYYTDARYYNYLAIIRIV